MRKKSLHSNTLGYIFVAPTMLILLLFIGYPMINGIVNAFRDIELTSGREITFIGLKNFSGLFADPIFFTSVKNSFIFVFVSVVFHIVLGFCLALMMDREIIGRTFFRTISLMPWAMSGVAVALIWVWLYHPQFSPINDILLKLGIIDKHLIFIGDPKTAMVSVLIAHNWRTFPFAFIVILSGLQMIPKELYESAEIDGARGYQKFFHITIPQMSGIILTIALLDTMWTFVYFDLPWVMTRGGPVNSTHLMPTYVYENAFRFYNFGKAAAISVWILIINLAVALAYIYFSKKAEALNG
jgi:multiple sugar transport system permease protein